ncbi:MAG TPA: pilus assembly protein N-terminal domain-containing protein [Thermoguttaceae bacterium]|nr:pilus assembly protein N-terminal domain-containing protein [Thermoguttaceae bacterium]
MTADTLRGILAPSLIGTALFWMACGTAWSQQLGAQPASIVRQIQAAGERQEMTVHSSRILTLSPDLTAANRIPRAQVNNPDVLDVTPLSATQIQISAKKPGVTQVNLWDENGDIYTVDVIVYGDARELSMILEHEFPNAALRVVPLSNAVMISGYVDQPSDINGIMQLAEQYYPKVINLIQVGGVHQVLLHVKVMEVSRTKLRSLGFDWSIVADSGGFVTGTSGLINPVTLGQSAAGNIQFDILGSSSDFFGVLEALRQDNLAKVLAEPTLVTSSGRPAYFHVGGEFTVVPQGLAAAQPIQIKYGTRVDFVPIVLGNGRIRLEVRPEVSEIDESVTVDDIPGLRTRTVDTGVELQAGQTLAIAGLLQSRVESTRRGIPWVSDLPYAGALFRRVEEQTNEIELLIFVTPELFDAMDAEEVPPCGPGMRTTSPNDVQLGLRGHVEVPRCCPQGPPGMIPGQPGQIVPPDPMLPADGIVPADGILPPGQIVPPEQRLTPGPSEPPAPLPSAPVPSAKKSAFAPPQGKKPSARQGDRPVAATSDRAAELPGFMGPIGYELAD